MEKQRGALKRKTKYLAIMLIICSIFSIAGYALGFIRGSNITKNEFLVKKVNLIGVSFDTDNKLAKTNTFSCTPNDTEGDCSKQILENYKLIFDNDSSYCRRVVNDYTQSTLSNAVKLKNEILNNDINFLPPLSMPTAYCNDGTASYSENNSGTCSNHGGVRVWN